jgi:type IV secretion system protein VirD4
MNTPCFVVGAWQGTVLRDRGRTHMMLIGATRSGKDVGVVIPTLLTSPGSMVIHDVKGEDWYYTAGARQAQGSYVLYLNPTHPHSVRHNPLFEVRKGPNEIRDIQNIADMLIDPEGSNQRRDHWEKTSHTLLTGTALHVLYAEADKTLTGLAAFLSDPARSFYDTLAIMMRTRHLGDAVHPVIAQIAREIFNKGRDELSSVLSTAMSFLGLYRDPLMARTTSRCDFMIDDLQHADRPVALYLVTPPSDLSRTRAYMRLFLNQMGRRLTETWEADPLPQWPAPPRPAPQDADAASPPRHGLGLILNEFASLGHLEFLESEVAYLAGYGIRVLFVVQSLNQLDHHYGTHNALVDNCHLRAFYAANDDRAARRIADMLSTATVTHDQRNVSGHRLALWLTHLSKTVIESARPLLTPGEVLQVPPDQAILVLGGQRPIKAEKLRYYADPRFQPLALPPPDVQRLALPPARSTPWQHEAIKRLAPPSREMAQALHRKPFLVAREAA